MSKHTAWYIYYWCRAVLCVRLCVYVASRPVHSRWDIWGGFFRRKRRTLVDTDKHTQISSQCEKNARDTNFQHSQPRTRSGEWIPATCKNHICCADSSFCELRGEFHGGHVKWKIGVTVLGKHIHTHTRTLYLSVALFFSHTHCVPWVLLSAPRNLTGRDLQ